MKFFQIQGTCQKRKVSAFGLVSRTYESFRDSQFLGENSAITRFLHLQEIAVRLKSGSPGTQAWLRQADLSTEILKLENLKIYPVESGDYLRDGVRVFFEVDRPRIKEEILWHKGTPTEYKSGMLVKVNLEDIVYVVGDADVSNIENNELWGSGCGCCASSLGAITAWSEGISEEI